MIRRTWLLPLLACLVAFNIAWFYFSLDDVSAFLLHNTTKTHSTPSTPSGNESHPIIDLVRKADIEFQELLGKETNDLASAAWTYRERRGRHPPPGFAEWHQYAVDHNVVMVEEFWDQIYHDLTPLWSLSQKQMRAAIATQNDILKVRNGKVTSSGKHFWVEIWVDMLESVSKYLPDLDMALNVMDEPRLFVPWENMEGLIKSERHSRRIQPPVILSSVYGANKAKVPPFSNDTSEYKIEWNHQGPIFERVRQSCPPDSPTRKAPLQTDFSSPPRLTSEFSKAHSPDGYVSNSTLSASICHQPDLQGLHGYFIEAISTSFSDKLFPLFGSSKLSVNSEILMPATMSWKYDPRFAYTGKVKAWNTKSDTLFWRGLASGGRNREENWKGFHRHRLVSMLNGTQALLMPNNSGFIDIQSLPLEPWQLEAWNNTPQNRSSAMGTWLSSFTEAGFIGLFCEPKQEGNGCKYTDYLFKTLEPLGLKEQHHHKYVVDVDGNSYSGRYRDFLLSNSVPIKATLFKEWYDSRLVAWKHFVPMDNRFLDIYGIMEFFLGYDGGKKKVPGHDQMASKIAMDGHEWSQKVLRQVDMSVYTWRLLLEYARIMDDDRENLGWADDMIT